MPWRAISPARGTALSSSLPSKNKWPRTSRARCRSGHHTKVVILPLTQAVSLPPRKPIDLCLGPSPLPRGRSGIVAKFHNPIAKFNRRINYTQHRLSKMRVVRSYGATSDRINHSARRWASYLLCCSILLETKRGGDCVRA